ncbi:MAG: DUF4351 domain-containing protein [Firmicutes bacterium]|nr:DUF4351 domain-containing protein [Bacillota bacterium]
MASGRIDHDQLFKELLRTFFADFLAAFFPEAYQALDLSEIRFLQQEVTDLAKGGKRSVDILAEVRLKGEEGLILVHVENQAQVDQEFGERMYIYFNRLYHSLRRRILPIAVFSHDGSREEPDTFEMKFRFLDVLHFRFYKLQLRRLYWRDYLHKDNAAVAALMAKMGFRPGERAQVKLEIVRMLARMRLDPARSGLIMAFVETYLPLNRAEEEDFQAGLATLEPKEAATLMEFTTSWHEKGRAEGRVEGRVEGLAEGLVQGQVELMLRQIRKRFGAVPQGLEDELRALPKERLGEIGEALLDVSSPEELRALLH